MVEDFLGNICAGDLAALTEATFFKHKGLLPCCSPLYEIGVLLAFVALDLLVSLVFNKVLVISI